MYIEMYGILKQLYVELLVGNPSVLTILDWIDYIPESLLLFEFC